MSNQFETKEILSFVGQWIPSLVICRRRGPCLPCFALTMRDGWGHIYYRTSFSWPSTSPSEQHIFPANYQTHPALLLSRTFPMSVNFNSPSGIDVAHHYWFTTDKIWTEDDHKALLEASSCGHISKRSMKSLNVGSEYPHYCSHVIFPDSTKSREDQDSLGHRIAESFQEQMKDCPPKYLLDATLQATDMLRGGSPDEGDSMGDENGHHLAESSADRSSPWQFVWHHQVNNQEVLSDVQAIDTKAGGNVFGTLVVSGDLLNMDIGYLPNLSKGHSAKTIRAEFESMFSELRIDENESGSDYSIKDHEEPLRDQGWGIVRISNDSRKQIHWLSKPREYEFLASGESVVRDGA